MKRRALLGSLVVLAVAAVLWLKPDSPMRGLDEAQEQVPSSEAAQVLLFADPGEAGSSCGCGEIIRMVRGANVPGVVAVQEFDPRNDPDTARLHSVQVNPTVIITSSDGVAQARFEGESPEVITGLREALEAVAATRPAEVE